MVFQKIVGEILARTLGDYLEGLNQNISVGLWNGELTLQNVKIKKDVLQKLGLPVEVSFGSVEELKLKIPWKNLASSKIEVYLSGLYLIANILPKENWIVPTKEDNLQKKKQDIQKYTQQLIKSLLDRKSSKSKSAETPGFTQKLILKIIDNLQISISNVHVRIQASQGYSFGVTLQSINLSTVNKEGKDEYIDRTKQQYKNQPLRKKLHLKNFGVYWDTNSKNLYEKDTLEKGVIASMNYMIHKGIQKPLDRKYIVFLSFQANLFQRQKGLQFQQPQYHFIINVQQFRVQMQNRQAQQAIRLSQMVKEFNQKKRPKLSISLSSSSNTEAKLLQEFKRIFRNYYNTSHLEIQQKQKYESIIMRVDLAQLFPIIKQVVKDAQKKKMLEQKSVKKTGWFTWSKQELTPEQIQQVQTFLSDNLVTQQQVNKVTRPKQYFFLRVDLNAAESEISIGKSDNVLKRGLSILSTNLSTTFMMRQQGYKAQFSMSDLSLDLYVQKGLNIIRTPFYTKSTHFRQQKYIEAKFQTNPLQSAYMDAQLKVIVRPGVFLFNPLIMSRIKQFTNIKVSQQTEQMALQAYGSAKQKAAKSLEKSIANKKLKIFNIDIQISAPLIIIPFEAGSNKDCWAISMSSIRIFTDPKTLNPVIDKTSQMYRLKLKDIWMSSYKFKGQIMQMTIGKPRPLGSQLLIDNFDLEIMLELQKIKDDISKPNVYLSLDIPKLNLLLGKNSYKNLCNIGNSFVQQKQQALKIEDPVEMIRSEKKSILQSSEKKGFIHKRSPHSQLWNKYIAVLSGNYIYLYANKTDISYDSFIYIKNAKIIDQSRELVGRDYSVRIQNKVNSQLISFENRKSLDQWKQIIQSTKHQVVDQIAKDSGQQNQEDHSKKRQSIKQIDVLYMKLLFEVSARIGGIQVIIYDDVPEAYWLQLKTDQISLNFRKFECFTEININLSSLSLIDNLQQFRNPDLQYLFKPANSDLTKSLLHITVLQAIPGDPRYKNIDNHVTVVFGIVIFNWKPNSVNKLMKFFLSKSSKKPKQQPKPIQQEIDVISTLSGSVLHIDDSILSERISFKLEVSIQNILIRMVNKHNKVMQGTINFEDFNLNIESYLNSTNIKVNVKDLVISDSTNYPNTIVAELQYFPNSFPVFKTKQDQGAGLVSIDITTLNKVNENGKNFILHITFNEIVIDLIMQPFLRCIYFVTDQAIPSLSTSNGQQAPPPVPQKITAPTETKTQLVIVVINSAILLKPTSKSEQQISLNIPKLVLKNSSIWRQYTTNSQKVLTSLYNISINDLRITKDNQNLTNNFNFQINLEFISSPEFYKQKFGDAFLGGKRIYLSISPIVLRLSNTHFRFLMKCLNWNLSYSDNCSDILYPPQKKQQQEDQQKQQQVSYPLYLNLSIKMLTLAVTDMMVPISNIALNQVQLNMVNSSFGSDMKFQINSIIGSYFTFSENKYIEKGMIGKLANYGQHTYEQLTDLTQLVRLFNKQDQYVNNKSDLVLVLKETDKQKVIDLSLQKCTLNLQLKHLLKISQLFSLEKLESPPEPRFKEFIIKNKQIKKKAATTNIHLYDLVLSTGDEKHQQIKILGQVHVALLNREDKTKQQALQILKKDHDGSIPFSNMSIQITNLELFLMYNPKDGVPRKRTLLNPVTITIQNNTSYTITNDLKLCLTHKYQIRINSLIIQATISDSVRFRRVIDINKQIIQQFNQVNQKKKENQLQPEVELVQQLLVPQTQKPLQKTEISRIDFGDTQILLINDAEGMFVPIIKLSIKSIKPSSYIIPSKTELKITTILDASFFNPKNARWQPILESSTISLRSEQMNQAHNTQSIIELIAEHSINFNLSSQLLISLLISLKFASEVQQMLKHQNQHNHSVLLEQNGLQLPSPYTVLNITNTEFKIILTETTLKNLNYENRSEAKDYIQRHRQTIVPPKFKGYIFIPSEADQIDVAFGKQQHTVKLNRFLKHRIGDSKYFFACQVDKLNRMIKISCQTTLTNYLEVPIYVHYQKQTIKLLPGKRIPLENVEEFQISRDKGFKTEKIYVKNLEQTNMVKFVQTNQYLFVVNKSYEVNGLLYRPLFIKAPLTLINCLPKPLSFQFFQENKQSSSKLVQSQEEYELHSYNDFDNVFFKLYVPGFHWCKPISVKNNFNKQIDVVLRDIDTNFCVIKALIFKNEYYFNYQVHIYSPGFIINDTPFDLSFFVSPSSENKKKKDKHFKNVAGQKKIHRAQNLDNTIILLGADSGNELKLTDKKDDSSTMSGSVAVVDMSQVQVQVVKEFKGQQQIFFVTLTMQIDFKQMHKHSQVQSKQVRFKAKYIIHNTACRIQWKQVDTKQWFVLQHNQKDIFYLLQKSDSPQIVIKTQSSSQSAFLQVTLLGQMYFAVENKGKPFYLKTDSRAADGHIIIQISEVKQQNLPYQLHNKLNSQIDIRMIGFNRDVHPGEITNFVWSDPNDQKNLCLTIIQNNQQIYSLQINPDEVTSTKQLKITRQGKQMVLKVFVRVEGDKRIITIDEQQDIIDRQIKLSTIKILFKQLGISFIMNHEGLDYAYQAFFVSMKYLELFYQKTSFHDVMQFRLGFLQIDQNSPEFIKYPVMLTPQRFNYFSKAGGNDNLINILVKRDIRHQKQTVIKQILVDIKDLALRISQESFHMVIGLRLQIMKIMDPEKQEFKIIRKKDKWREKLVARQNHKVYIQHIAISPLVIKLTAGTSFGTGVQKVNKHQQLMGRFFTAFGVAFANIQQALLSFKGINLENIFDTPSGIQDKLIIHYKATFLSQIYKVFGSLTLLGDPRGLFLNISTGLKDMVSKPVQGLVQGPLELGKGLASGASSLYSHVMGGVLGSVTKIIRSISMGLNVLTFDQKYIHDNLVMQTRKTHGFVSGLGKAGRIFFFAYKDAILGIIVKPIRGAQKQGIFGYLIGGMTAMAGLVIKPVTGILDFLWILLDSLKNTIVYQQDSANQSRIRQPRVFYGRNSVIHEYSSHDANSLLLLRQKNLLHNQIIMQTFEFSQDLQLVILSTQIMIINPQKRSVLWQIKLKDIGSVSKTHRGIEVKSKVFGNQKQNIRLIDTSTCNRQLKQQIRQAIEIAAHETRQ